jgi:hypothetical protein
MKIDTSGVKEDVENGAKDCPSFSCQEYRDYFDKLAN